MPSEPKLVWLAGGKMDLLNRLSRQATELWQKQALCKDDQKKIILLKQFKEIYGQYLKHRDWLRIMAQ
jgi:hypothetical protein